jgi:hypothetical protein
MIVAIVLDPNYADLELLADSMPVWAVDSSHNRSVAEKMWNSRGGADAFQGITVFKPQHGTNAEANCQEILDQVDLHHGVYSSGQKIQSLHVIGAVPADGLRSELSSIGFSRIKETQNGFIASIAETDNLSPAASG